MNRPRKRRNTDLVKLLRSSENMLNALQAAPHDDQTRKRIALLSKQDRQGAEWAREIKRDKGLGTFAAKHLREFQRKERMKLRKRLREIEDKVFVEVENLNARFLENDFFPLLQSGADTILPIMAELCRTSADHSRVLRNRFYKAIAALILTFYYLCHY